MTPERHLRQAIVEGDAESVARWLEEGRPRLELDAERTVLEVALAEGPAGPGRRDVVLCLLDGGIDPNRTFEPILPQAAKTGDTQLVQWLILGGARSRTAESEEDALEVAAAAGDEAMVDLLLEAMGASSFRIIDALRAVALAGQPGLFERLAPLAEDQAQVAAARVVLDRTLRLAASPNRHPRAGELHAAVGAADHAGVERILADGVTPGAFVVEWDGRPISALCRACQMGDARTAGALLRAGAAIDGLADGDGRLEASTPLIEAIRSGAGALARRLIAAGADVSAQRDEGAEGPLTPLLQLVMHGVGGPDGIDIGVAQALANDLVLAGAEVDAADARGHTAVFWAARRPLPRLLETLLKLGAEVGHLDKEGNAASTHALYRYHLASEKPEREDFRSVLDFLGGTVPRRLEAKLMAAAFRGQLDRCRRYLGRGADPRHRLDGWRAIDTARAGRNETIVALLEQAEEER
ncbi:MAG: hypothetical protein AAF657_14330 [Acidobacteriota bacterium]